MTEVFEWMVAILVEQGHTREEAEALVLAQAAFQDEIAAEEELCED